jgi:hypothetical protein
MLQVRLSRYCLCLTHMLQVFYLYIAYVWNGFHVFSGVFAHVSDACFICFIYHLLYVANVVSGCFISRPCVAHWMRVRTEKREGCDGPRAGDVQVVRPLHGRAKHKRMGDVQAGSVGPHERVK